MKLHILAKSYDTHGAHSTLSPIGDFLLTDAPNFGDAVEEITITLCFHDSGPAKRGLQGLLKLHQAYRASLPKVTFRKSKRLFEIEIASELMDGRDWKSAEKISLPLFQAGVEEVCHALQLIKKRITAADQFDVGAFLNYCEKKKSELPTSLNALQKLLKELEMRAQASLSSDSLWETLDIDWDCFHPDAIHTLDSVFFWDDCNDFSPHGNDTGADVLAEYLEWIEAHPKSNPLKLLELLAKQWGYESFASIEEDVRADMILALTFAEIKVKNKCDETLRQMAFSTLEWQGQQAEAAKDWEHRLDRIKSIKIIEDKLRSLKLTGHNP